MKILNNKVELSIEEFKNLVDNVNEEKEKLPDSSFENKEERRIYELEEKEKCDDWPVYLFERYTEYTHLGLLDEINKSKYLEVHKERQTGKSTF
jgi:hypothetical protein